MTPDHIRQIANWPRETWSDSEYEQVREYRARLHADLVAIADQAEREDRNLTPEEMERFQSVQAEFDRFGGVPPHATVNPLAT